MFGTDFKLCEQIFKNDNILWISDFLPLNESVLFIRNSNCDWRKTYYWLNF